MPTDFEHFGDPARLRIEVRWTRDAEPRARRPAVHGWSMGDLRITVRDRCLTEHLHGSKPRPFVSWYLSPLFRWLAENWAPLLHEEDFAWEDGRTVPALVSCREVLRETIDRTDPAGRAVYRAAQHWAARHGLRTAAEGGLLPDLFLRRFGDEIELSWGTGAPLFAPDGFAFLSVPGVARLPVEDVAGPLWQMLRWFADHPPRLDDPADQENWSAIVDRIETLDRLPTRDLEAAHLPATIACLLEDLGTNALPATLTESRRMQAAPAISELSPRVAMFGGVDPNLTRGDAATLLALLAGRGNGTDAPALADLVGRRGLSPLRPPPHADGYAFAEDLLDDLGEPTGDHVDVEALVARLGIAVERRALETRSIRGVALAGEGLSPCILVNTSHPFNSASDGQRFTIAHELCHILHDRARARRVAHASGPWVAPGFEKRANAFAAGLLMPRDLVIRHLGARAVDEAVVDEVATRLHVGRIALVEHLHNLRLIDKPAYEMLEVELRHLS